MAYSIVVIGSIFNGVNVHLAIVIRAGDSAEPVWLLVTLTGCRASGGMNPIQAKGDVAGHPYLREEFGRLNMRQWCVTASGGCGHRVSRTTVVRMRA